MTDRFTQPVEQIRRPGSDAPITSYRRLVKRLGVADASVIEQRRAVQAWIDGGHHASHQLVLSLEAAGFKFPTTAGAHAYR